MWSRRAVLVGLAAMPTTGLACGWDRDTLRDELQKTPSLYDLAVGQLPRHSEAWYLKTIEESTESWSEGSDLGAGDDLGMALVHLGRFDEADRVLSAMHRTHPLRYETLSNVGVLRKKQERYAESAAFLGAALAHRPEGHLGIGSWYLDDVRWREQSDPTESFLGVAYDAVPNKGSSPHYAAWQFVTPLVQRAAKDLGVEVPKHDFSPRYKPAPGALGERVAVLERRLHKLLRFDQGFADAVLVFGDVLADQRHSHLASFAYARALSLEHPRGPMVEARIGMLVRHWREISGPRDLGSVLKAYRAHRAAAVRWVTAFQGEEARAVAKGGRPTFAETEDALIRRGTKRNRRSL